MTFGRLKTVVLIIILFALFSSSFLLAYESFLLHNDVTTLREALQELEGRHEDLLKRYENIRSSYITLLQNYTLLQQRLQGYFELQSRYEELLSEHQALQASYAKLKEVYEELRFAVYCPLWSNETVKPTISELKKWLAEDDTDKISYSKWDFVCGDYALMLSVKAKMNHWDMGIVMVLGRDAQGNRFNHVFNAIGCVEGLVYVEPQNDQVFYGSISEGSWYYHPGFGRIYVEFFTIVVLYHV